VHEDGIRRFVDAALERAQASSPRFECLSRLRTVSLLDVVARDAPGAIGVLHRRYGLNGGRLLLER
jgi:hypothetical protein